MSRIKFTELSGKDVISQDGRVVGTVSDIVLDASAWAIPTLVVKLARDHLEQFHMKRPMFGTQTIQIPTTYVSGLGDKVILHKTLEDLTALAKEQAPPAPPPKATT
jgi:sporulation protein YlmC with PRC-barrel domain